MSASLFAMALRSSIFAAPSLSAQRTAGYGAGQLSIGELELSVHENVIHTLGHLIRVLVRCFINDRLRIENRDVREKSLFEQPARNQMLAFRRQRSDFANRLVQRNQMQIARIVPDKARHRAPRARMIVRFEKRAVERSF